MKPLVLLMLVACVATPAQLEVVLEIDEDLRGRVAFLEVEIESDGVEPVVRREPIRATSPMRFVASPADGDTTRAFDLTMVLRDADENILGRQHRRVSSLPDSASSFARVCFAEACVARECGEGLDCVSGRCVPLRPLVPAREESLADCPRWVAAIPEGRVPAPLSLYIFDEGEGDRIADQGSASANLSIDTLPGVEWLPHGLRLGGAALIHAEDSVHRETIAETRAGTLEAWVTPTSASQGGIARIVALEGDTLEGGIVLGHGRSTGGVPAPSFSGRFTGPDFATPIRLDEADIEEGADALNHLVMTFDFNGEAALFRNGVEVSRVDVSTFDVEEWRETYRLSVGSAAYGGRTWAGTVHLVAVYDRALSAEEVTTNFRAGPGPIIE